MSSKSMLSKVLYSSLFLMLLGQASCVNTQKTTTQTMQKDNIVCVGTLHPISQTTLEIKKGDTFCYNATVHASVGIEVAYEINNDKIVTFHSSKLVYMNKEKVEQNMPGADKATKTLVFQALEKGETNVVIKEVFRGDTKNTYNFKITVK